MKRNLLTALFALFIVQSFSQTSNYTNTYLKISGGRVAFGDPDCLGYSLAFEASYDVVKKPRWGLDKLLVGGEMIFENGVVNPPGANGTFEENEHSFFSHVSNTVLWPKVSYYPLKKIFRGFNIQLGPTVGYSNLSMEDRVDLAVDNTGTVIRSSYLSYGNGFNIGYRVSTGIEFDFTQRILIGFRLDFSNNTNSRSNTLIGLKAGIGL